MKKNSTSKKRKVNIPLLFNILFPLIIYYVIEVFFCVFKDIRFLMPFTYEVPVFLFSVFFIYIFYIFLYSIFNNTKYSALFISIFGLLIAFLSKVKYFYMEEPLYVSDALYLSNFGESLGYASSSMSSVLLSVLPFLIFTIILIVLILIYLFKHNYKMKNKKIRLTSFAITSILLLVLIVPDRLVNNFVLNKIYDIGQVFTTPIEFYVRYGNFGGMYGTLLGNRIFPQESYNEKEIEKEINSVKEVEDKSLNKPDVIILFSESFWNADKIDEVKFDKKLTTNFEKLKEEGLYYNMISPSYGGISANVEFEFMTGFTLDYYMNGFIPYMYLYNDDSYKSKPSLIREFKNNNYYTKISSFGGKDLFGANKVYNIMDVDEVEFIDPYDKSYTKGFYASDKFVVDSIISELENKPDDQNLFHLFMTMQNHMPYNAKKYKSEEFDINVTYTTLPEEQTAIVKSYCQGVYDADKELSRLYEYIKTRDKDTILIFFGDHLPVLNSNYKDSRNILLTLDYFNTDDKLLNLYRKYNTEALVLSNMDMTSLKEENESVKYLGPDLLSTYLINHMDIKIDEYYKWLYQMKDVIPASNTYVAIDPSGKIYYTSSLKDDMKKNHDFRENVQYKYFNK